MSRLEDKRSEGFGFHRGSTSGGNSFYTEHRLDVASLAMIRKYVCVKFNPLLIRGQSRGSHPGGRSRGGFRSRGRGRGGLGFGAHASGGSKFAKSYSEEVQEQVDELYKKKYVTIAT